MAASVFAAILVLTLIATIVWVSLKHGKSPPTGKTAGATNKETVSIEMVVTTRPASVLDFNEACANPKSETFVL